MRIWKWSLQVTDVQLLSMPEGAQFLSVQTQDDMPQLWALVDETASLTNRKLATYGTGNPMPDTHPGRYVDTYQVSEGALVFHVFDVT